MDEQASFRTRTMEDSESSLKMDLVPKLEHRTKTSVFSFLQRIIIAQRSLFHSSIVTTMMSRAII